ncbi:MAG TPA: PilZ domain-containing protein [Burkholderiaceae bacterium]|nr:PilZ domain-containing protein [Burkholderiaceae bacterium]
MKSDFEREEPLEPTLSPGEAPAQAAVAPGGVPDEQAERRRSTRKLLRRSAKVVLPGRKVLRARTLELSRDGLSVLIEQSLRGGACEVRFDLSAGGKLETVAVQTRVAYCVLAGKDGFRVGFEIVAADATSRAAIDRFLAEG